MSEQGAAGHDVFHPTPGMLYELAWGLWSVYVGIGLWKIRPKAVKRAKWFLCFAMLTNAAIVVIALTTSKIDPNTEDRFVLNGLVGIAWDLVWLAYLASSKRVQATYAE